jgi:hypothetical protein
MVMCRFSRHYVLRVEEDELLENGLVLLLVSQSHHGKVADGLPDRNNFNFNFNFNFPDREREGFAMGFGLGGAGSSDVLCP